MLAAGIVAAILPDFDGIAFKLGIHYGGIWGHRGFTHTLGFALLAGLIGAWLARHWKLAPWQGYAWIALCMFPEGTRIPRGQKGIYKSGGTRLAIETGAPVIPIAVTSAKCWPRKAFIKTPGIVDISIGKPIPSAGRQPDELMREVEAWIEAEMRRLDPEAYAGAAANT